MDITFYRYRIVIAPKYEIDTKLKSLRLDFVDDDVMAYLNSSSPIGAGNIDEWNSVTEGIEFEKWDELSDFSAYELSITFNNLTDSFMREKGMSEKTLLKALQNAKLTIQYNNSVDTFELKDIIISELTGELQNSRDDLLELSENGQTYDQFMVFN